VNDVSVVDDRSYFGGSDEFTALGTVLREIPSRTAIRVCGTPSAASLLINAQSSKVMTLQVSSAHFSPGRTAQISTVIDTTSANRSAPHRAATAQCSGTRDERVTERVV
jgi:hypothetical protein